MHDDTPPIKYHINKDDMGTLYDRSDISQKKKELLLSPMIYKYRLVGSPDLPENLHKLTAQALALQKKEMLSHGKRLLGIARSGG